MENIIAQPQVTVIVPMYNVAPYIEKCATSLFQQTLESIEFLFIDDCSPDNSTDVLKQTLKNFPNRAGQTRIIRMPENSGSAGVRRTGMIEARGEYVIHCDGDDWVDTDLYELMYRKAKETDADIVVCDEIHELNDGGHLHEERTLPSDCKELMRNWYREILGLFVHNKLVRRSLYVDNDILPCVGLNMWEDNSIVARMFYHGKRLAQIHGSCYHYNRTNVGAMTAGYGIKQVEQMIGVAQLLTDFFESKPDADDFKNTKLAFQFLARINLITDSFANLRRYGKTFRGSEAIVPLLDPKAFSSKGRFRFRMVQCHLAWLFILMFKSKNALQSLRGKK